MTDWMDLVREESKRVGEGVKPNYLVVTDRISLGLLSSQAALFWHGFLYGKGLETTIVELSGYDWDRNPANIQCHKKSEDALLAIANTDAVVQ